MKHMLLEASLGAYFNELAAAAVPLSVVPHQRGGTAIVMSVEWPCQHAVYKLQSTAATMPRTQVALIPKVVKNYWANKCCTKMKALGLPSKQARRKKPQKKEITQIWPCIEPKYSVRARTKAT